MRPEYVYRNPHNLVGKVGFEPTQREAADLQSAVTLQLHRLPNNLILEVHSRESNPLI